MKDIFMKDIFMEKPVGRRTWNQPGAAGIFYAQAVNKKSASDAARGWTVTKIVRTNTKRQV